MSDELKRRDFLLLAAASGAAFTGFAGSSDGNSLAGTRQPAVPHWHPALDGTFADDNATLEEAETDQGGSFAGALARCSVRDPLRMSFGSSATRIGTGLRSHRADAGTQPTARRWRQTAS